MERQGRKLIRLLGREGSVQVAVKGDRWQFKLPTKKGRVTVPKA